MLWLTYHLGFYINVSASEKKNSAGENLKFKGKPLVTELLIIFLTLRVVNYLNIIH